MSYARWGEDGSDVYVYESAGDVWTCWGCHVGNPESDDDSEAYRTITRQEMLDHLEAHRFLGAVVPEHAFERLRREIATGVSDDELVAAEGRK